MSISSGLLWCSHTISNFDSESVYCCKHEKQCCLCCFVTCRIHSESSKALRKESSESDEVALGAQALSSFLNAAFTCRVSAKSTGTSSQFRAESTLRPCQNRDTRDWASRALKERKTFLFAVDLVNKKPITEFYCQIWTQSQVKIVKISWFPWEVKLQVVSIAVIKEFPKNRPQWKHMLSNENKTGPRFEPWGTLQETEPEEDEKFNLLIHMFPTVFFISYYDCKEES